MIKNDAESKAFNLMWRRQNASKKRDGHAVDDEKKLVTV